MSVWQLHEDPFFTRQSRRIRCPPIGSMNVGNPIIMLSTKSSLLPVAVGLHAYETESSPSIWSMQYLIP
ncbi:unnamed protein product, partial [Amoebophrya sp. A120]|eukprot:GSA120T00007041001.1